MTDLRARLAAARTRLRLAAAARASLLAASVALISLLTLAVIDALSPLAPLARLIALSGIAFFTLFLALRAAVRDGLLAPLPLDRIARAFERRTGAIDNALINALQLSPAASTADALPRALAERAIDRAERRLDETPPTSAIDPAPLKRSGALFTISTLAVAIIFLTVPRLPAFAAPRLLEPFGGHPPFTWTDFSITIDPAQPIIGDDARITVDLDGRIPTALGFIAESADPTARRAWPMTAASETRYTTLLRNLRDPIRFHVAGDTGRSRTITIDPIAQPRVQRAALRLTPPAYTNLPPRELDLRSPFATPHTVLLGTRAELTITSTLPIADLEHTGFDETTVESTTITAARTFTTPGDVRLSLTARAAS
ncbi:MAG: hypothetical protein VYC34_04540, partial [Planctomycetota bacterium]|nr:hypothetical protein [Planctomycetota bacterium]